MAHGTAEITKLFHTKLKGFIFNRVKNYDLANDILQDTLIKIHGKYHTLNDQDKLKSWVYQIARNSIIDHHRKAVQELKKARVSLDTENEISLNNDLAKCIIPFIDELPEKYREALLLTGIEGLSQKDYALKMGLSYTGAKSRVQRARVMLKELFTSCCEIQADAYGNILGVRERASSPCRRPDLRPSYGFSSIE
ncbi:MAG: RNA polymerase sigma factor SigZ [Bacteroidetes bacterium]|nr:RNA polymerase sigma factor SigZ [Bacteroidota bacterium]